ncbi:MAG: hypothetical protein MR779_04395 [Tenericutes bacterium]|nr:hypothetical protein [Mycoplasmatota bacterium]
MNNEELVKVVGGISFSSSLINAVVKAFTTIYDFGRRLGSGLLRSRYGQTCPLE